MHRLSQLGHDEVGEVNDVVDGVEADGGQAVLQPERRGLNLDVLEDEGAETGAEVEILDFDVDGWVAGGKEVETDRVEEFVARDGSYFAGHAVVAPEIGAVRDGLVVDLDDLVGRHEFAGEFAVEFNDAGVVAIDAQFLPAG